MSVPAAKARSPAPVMTRPRAEPSAETASQISATRSYMAKVKALRASGRLNVIVPMPSATSERIAPVIRAPLASDDALGLEEPRRRFVVSQFGHNIDRVLAGLGRR